MRDKLLDLASIWEGYERELADRDLLDSRYKTEFAAKRIAEWREIEG